MTKSTATLDDAMDIALSLPPLDRVRLIERLASTLERDIQTQSSPKRSLYGICADLGKAPSAAEIDQARRDAWAGFPREDI